MLKNFIKKYNLENKKLIIACSGWPDSIFLVHIFAEILPKKNLIIAHFNHHLRWNESQRDEEFVKNFCLRNNLIFEFWQAQISQIAEENKIWIEEAARIARYEFLREIKDKYNAEYILTAHHLDDKIETFMLNLIRWTKLKWLISIEEKNWDLLRPLLHLSKEEILKELNKINQDYVIDSTNKDDIYYRNKIRLNIVPEFEKINKSYRKNFSDLMNYFEWIKSYFDKIIISLIKIENWKKYFEVEEFNNLDELLKNEFIRYIYETENSWTIWLSKWNIAEIIKFINSKWNYTEKNIQKLNLEKINGKVWIK